MERKNKFNRICLMAATSCLLLAGWSCKKEEAKAAQVYPVVLKEQTTPPLTGHLLPAPHLSPSGGMLDANSGYFLKDEKPWFPVMGEIHYARLPREEWEESIRKMKASGIDVIASYVFWNYHEEEQGRYDWTGDRDLRAFAELCASNDLFFFPRIGPWCHGEVRNGGFPDWIMNLEGGLRKDNPRYMRHVKRFFNEIGRQLQGLNFKDGGPVIGVQIENEYRFNNPRGYEHLLNLKELAIKAGLDVPYYTATGWPGSNLRQREFIPVWGGYPDAPWSKGSQPLALSGNYLFGPLRNDPLIGFDLSGEQDEQKVVGYQYPYATAEMGGGNQITYHRRPVITSDDVVAQAYVKVGSGANLMGYYMYHGGSNKIGKHSTLQESRATKYPNDYPIINYDFYSPLGQWGEINEAYRDFKQFHLFLNAYGDRLAQMLPAFPETYMHVEKPDDTEGLRIGVRSNGHGGFLFVNNYQRGLEMPEQQTSRFHLITPLGDYFDIPHRPLSVPGGTKMILPFNIRLENVLLKHANVQPVSICRGKETIYLFSSFPANESELFIADEHIAGLTLDGKKRKSKEGVYQLVCTPDEMHRIEVEQTDGKQFTLLLVTSEQARNCWKLECEGQEFFCFTAGELIPEEAGMTIRSKGSPRFDIDVYPASVELRVKGNDSSLLKSGRNGFLTSYKLVLPEASLEMKVEDIVDPSPFIPASKLLPEDERLKEVPSSLPGPRYTVNFTPVEGSLYWKLNLPEWEDSNLCNLFLELDYTGDTGSLYNEGGLVADDYYAGLPMTYSMRRLGDRSAHELLFQVIPWSPGLQIYIEKEAREALNAQGPASLRGARLIPQYEIKLTAH